ncbi:MAG: S9 family peptidase [Bacteroidetes bacterium]|nr:MAG: S9 family peptidase [Bacteroidota bacterium]
MKQIFFAWIGSCLMIPFLSAQEALSYQKPPKEILELVDVERAPSVSMDSKHEYVLFSYRPMYKNLEDLSQDELRLGGLRINPNHYVSSRITYVNKLALRKFGEENMIAIKGLPANARISYLTWSPNEKWIAFANTVADGLELWLLDVEKAEAKKLGGGYMNACLGNPISWFKNSESILVKMRPKNAGKLVLNEKALPKGPTVSFSEEGEKAQNRTYQDLLKNKQDEANFENLVKSELVQVSVVTDWSYHWMDSDLFDDVRFSPDGKYVLISTINRPFSYIVPYGRFPSKWSVYDQTGKFVHEVNDVPLREVLPKGFMSTSPGKRWMNWRADKAASLYFIKALDDGDASKEMEYRDELYSWEAPFQSEPVALMKTKQRFSGITWGTDEIAVASDYWWNTRNTKTYLFNPSKPGGTAKILFDRNYQDQYSDPGEMETKRTEFGTYVLNLEKGKVFLIGDGHTEKGQFPFIDQMDLMSGKKKRLYQSTYTDKKERILSILDAAKGQVLVRIESQNEYPNYFLRNWKGKKEPVQLTQFENPFKSIEGVHKELIKYKRKDGLELSGELYLPLSYEKGKKYPMIMWAYPQEYKDKSSASQVTTNASEFIFPYYGSPIYWVTRGYVVLNDAAFPIVGEGETEPNDSFIEQLVSNAEAAIDAVDKLGYIDRKRVAVGGHSYGAFMTANLLTHSDLFACGVARSGAYNRTLTPFGFQSEERSYWEAPQVYNTMSPFMNANKMDHPILLIHGQADNNPGTFTLQSERYFHALKGMGKPARLVLLPMESHGYAAIESILHVLWEQDQWFEKHLKAK